MISESEKEYIRLGCESGVRADGREPKDYRSLTLEGNIYPHVEGSSRVKIGESFDVLATVKFEIHESTLPKPDSSLIEYLVELSPQSVYSSMEEQQASDLCVRVATTLSRSVRGWNGFPWDALSVVNGKYYWKVFVDILILKMDGDPTDICSIASYVAFQHVRIPKIHQIYAENGQLSDFEVESDINSYVEIDFSHMPVTVTVAKMVNVLLFDPVQNEVDSSDVAVSLAIDKKLNICGFHFVRSGTISPATIASLFKSGQDVAQKIFSDMETYTTVSN